MTKIRNLEREEQYGSVGEFIRVLGNCTCLPYGIKTWEFYPSGFLSEPGFKGLKERQDSFLAA